MAGRISRGHLVGLDSSNLDFLHLMAPEERRLILANAGEYVHVRDESRDPRERGRKGAEKSEESQYDFVRQLGGGAAALDKSAPTSDLSLQPSRRTHGFVPCLLARAREEQTGTVCTSVRRVPGLAALDSTRLEAGQGGGMVPRGTLGSS